MPLIKYKKKRNFQETAEPHTASVTPHAHLRFVVQKHHASHLHYDFRLEMAKVLKSWAVPKGPSMNPVDKRLAIMVEDHPYAYKDFEGTIPKGNYGAGNVIIWDEGTYELAGSDVKNEQKQLLSDLRKGKLSIIMHGQKLNGEFHLIKLKQDKKGAKNTWLLMKKPDKFSSKKDILKQDKSVRSESFSESDDEDTPAITSVKSAMPSHIKPMLAKLINKPFDKEGWLFEIKWDGYRIIAYINGKKTKLISRNGKDYTQVFAPVYDELSKLKFRGVVDGEMVAVNKEGRSEFQLLQKYQKTGAGVLMYYAFDLLWLDNHDLQELSLTQRKKILAEKLPPLTHVHISDHILQEGKQFFKAAKQHNLEGIMAKRMASHYLAGQRSSDWLKIKTKKRQEAIIVGYTAPRGSRKSFGALVLGIYEKHQLKYIGHTGSGFNDQSLPDLKKRLDKLIQPKSPFSIPPKTNAAVTWVKPQLVCEIAFGEWTEDGIMRQPIFVGLREDKLARSVFRENSITATSEINPKKGKVTMEKSVDKLTLTHPTKVYWPKEGYTKQDLVDYYRSIAKFILPYLKDRPEVLNRYPNGISKANFYQKNSEHLPEWISAKVFHSESEDKDINYLICQNEATLIYMANLGCIDINPWLARAKSADYPDFCLLDLDPEGIDFKAVVTIAQAIHTLLNKIGAANYCKTSGATGLHICIPLAAKYTFDQSRQFAELVANIIHQQLPNISSVVRSPGKRQGKVYIDYLQNRHAQTMAAPYCVRPKPGATVSTPLEWHEVNSRLLPAKFTIKTIHKRLNKVGDLWKPVLGKGINLNSCIKKLQKMLGETDYRGGRSSGKREPKQACKSQTGGWPNLSINTPEPPKMV